MLAELAAINAAYAVIKEVISNGQELHEAGSHIASFFTSKKELEKKVKAAPVNEASLLEEFFALEEARRKEKELRDFMLIAGRPGLLADWDKFQKNAVMAADNERKKRLKELLRQQEQREQIMLIISLILLCGVIIAMIFGSVYIMNI